MIPLKDSIPAQRTPYVRNALLLICGVAFLLQMSVGEELVFRYGMIPARVLDGDPGTGLVVDGRLFGYRGDVRIGPAGVPEWLTLLTCTFLHGGVLHFLGNMLFLWIFGDNVEDRFGPVKFLLFYLGCGVAASAAHLYSAPDSVVPTIGASGAIAGVMGAYLFLYPRSRVLALIPFGFVFLDVVLPAPFFLGYWFLLQLFQGVVDRGVGGGVAWWAHIGGFVVGAAVAGLLRLTEQLKPRPDEIVLSGRPMRRMQFPGARPGGRRF